MNTKVFIQLVFYSQFKYVFPNGGLRHIIYTEDLGTKTNKGRLMHKKICPKQVTIFPNKENCDCCPVQIFYRYNSLLPLKLKCQALYLRPRQVFSDGAWYLDTPIGVNKLRNFVKEVTLQAGIKGFFSNHSLQSTAATWLYQVGMEE